jgi:uncharacterized HhH-GPD family protein
MNNIVKASISDVAQIGPFDFRWPDAVEHFESGWTYTLRIDGESHKIRHGLGGRPVYGRERVHTVTWLDGAIQVEGVEADDYPSTGALLSSLRRLDKKLVRTYDEVGEEYGDFHVVEHRREIDAKWSRQCLAVKLAEDDLRGWAVHAWIRAQQRRVGGVASNKQQPPISTRRSRPLPPSPSLSKLAVADALMAHANMLAVALGGGSARFTVIDAANDLIHEDPFAFLVAVIADQGIRAERAWAVPFELKSRIGTLTPASISGQPDRVREAFSTPPKLHRFVNQIADWIVAASRIVLDDYGGDAGAIWSGSPEAATLRARFERFPGIGQKKAAMAVEILERDLHVPIGALSGSDVAYDIHLCRVFLRTGLADWDDVGHMLEVARGLRPDRPGELDNPAWDVGRRWCCANDPDCENCPLNLVCSRRIAKGSSVRGI